MNEFDLKILFSDNLKRDLDKNVITNINYVIDSNLKSLSFTIESYYKVKIKFYQVHIIKSE